MVKHIVANALTLLIVALVVLAGVITIAQRSFYAAGPLAESVCLRVAPGANLRTVAGTLETQGAVSSGAIFRLGAQYTDRDDRLRFGSYLIPPEASMDAILDTITRGGASTCGTEVVFRVGVTRADVLVRTLDPATGRYAEVANFDAGTEPPAAYLVAVAEPDVRLRVTVAEGATSWQVRDALQRAEFLSGTIAEVPAEGSLSPDSYEVRRGADRAALIADMQARQSAILAAAWANRAEGLPLSTPEEALILASIIEKETSVPEERRTVASVFINRLRQGMRLQTDPTVIYGITLGEGTLGRGLRRSELDRTTPWNTYRIDGLPPTPIANPGRASIEAALNPDGAPYVFFVADGTGGHAFAVTLAEHNRNVARWREIEAQQNR